MLDFCPGYVKAPFKNLAANYPDASVYPVEDFRVEWGPIFHRGRLDGTARVLILGQDPGQHENVLRRILVGEAGRRVQGFLAKLGIRRRYAMINALLYSVYGSDGAKYVAKAGVRDYRNQWMAGLLAPGKLEAVVTFGTMAKRSWTEFTKAAGDPAVAVEHLTHPTFPESAGGNAATRANNTKQMLEQWNGALQRLFPVITHKDTPSTALELYGAAFAATDKADIPSSDLPAGIPPWMYDNDGWAKREGGSVLEKRRTIAIRVPNGVIP